MTPGQRDPSQPGIPPERPSYVDTWEQDLRNDLQRRKTRWRRDKRRHNYRQIRQILMTSAIAAVIGWAIGHFILARHL